MILLKKEKFQEAQAFPSYNFILSSNFINDAYNAIRDLLHYVLHFRAQSQIPITLPKF